MKTHIKISLFALGSILSVNTYAQAPNISYPATQIFSMGLTINQISPTNYGGAPIITGQTSTLAGNGTAGYYDATGVYAKFNQPLGAVVDKSGNVYVTDVGNERIRVISPGGVVNTFAGTGYPGAGNGTGTAASFYHPVGMCIDASGNIYVADEDNNMIRKITSAGVVTTVAGQASAGYLDGSAGSATFNLPCGVAVDAGGNLYVADYNNNVIRKISSSGTVSTFAGSTTGTAGYADGAGTAAKFNHPISIAIDAAGNLYVADRLNNLVREITPAGVVSTLAGQTASGYADGTGTAAKFSAPNSIAADNLGNIYVADEGNNRIRRIVVSSGVVTTLSGTGTAGAANGLGSASTFNNPFGIASDANNYLYVCDDGNNLVRKILSTPYAIDSNLPAGLTFNQATGVISGTPTATSPEVTCNVTAYNASGSNTAPVTMIVNPASVNFSANMNSVISYTPRVSGILTSTALSAASATNTQVETNIQYLDGLGRPLQTVQYQGSPTGKDVIQPYAYDQLGRDSVEYLPYTVAASSPGSYESNALTGTGGYTGSAQYQFYQTTSQGYVNTTNPYAGTNYEPSPLNRVIEKGAPGAAWQLSTSGVSGSGHTVKVAYALNNSTSFAADSVNGMQVSYYYATINSDNSRTLHNSGYYAANTLTVTISKDENWTNGRGGTVEEYKDIYGRVVLKRQYNYNGTLVLPVSTYYIYDDFGELAFVLTPLSGADQDGAISQTTLDNLCYQYQYDLKHRLTAKKIPGKGWEYIVYNAIDKPVATQDANQRSNNQWLFTKYDVLGRSVTTGIWNNNNSPVSLSSLQGTLSAITANLYEAPQNSGNGYSNAAWPTAYVTATLSLDFYDTYQNIPGFTSTSPYYITAGISKMSRGLPTVKKTAVLNTPTDQLWDAMYYDDLGRSISTYSQHYLGAVVNNGNYDNVLTTYNFTNQPTTVTRKHWNTNNTTYPLVTVFNRHIYDQLGRKTKTWEQIQNLNNTPTTNTLISRTDFNEIGQLYYKRLHSTTDSVNSAGFMQNIAYTYNERGWLLSSSAPLFAMQLYYNTGSAKAYNGNIKFQFWGTPGNLNKHYTYVYDRLNRMIQGTSTDGNYEYVGYDLAGNISSLGRYYHTSIIDNLTYNYSYTNQVQSISDVSGSNSGLVNGTTSFTWDANGNEKTQSNITNVQQNKTFSTYNILNLPQTVVANTSPTTSSTLTYTYDAAGNKLRRTSTGQNNTTDYISGIQYDGTTTPVLSFIQTEEGKAVPNGAGYDYVYYLGDNVGNTRVTFGTATGSTFTYQTDDYYPFGMEILGYIYSTRNDYLYNRKELQEETQEYDYGARFYDPVIGRFISEDKLADKFPWYSQYQFAGNEVPNATDLDGLEPAYPDHGRMVMGRDGQLNKGTANPQAIAYSKQQTRVTVEGSKLNPVAQAVSDVLVPIGNSLNTLITGKNPNGSKATVSDKISSVAIIIESAPAKGGEGGGGIGEGGGFPDNATVVRGGTNTPEQLAPKLQEVHPSGVQGASVECGTCSVIDLSKNIPHNKVGVTTVGDVRAAGGDVIKTSGTSPNHATLTGVSPETASKLLNPVIKNPSKP